MSQFINLDEETLIIIQWIAMVIPLLFSFLLLAGTNHVSEMSIDRDDPIFGFIFLPLMLFCNTIIAYSLYEDCLFFYDIFIGQSGEKYNNESVLFALNLSPIVGLLKFVSIISLLLYFSLLKEAKEESRIWTIPAAILITVNIIIGIPSMLLTVI